MFIAEVYWNGPAAQQIWDFADATDMPVGGKLVNVANFPEPSTYNTNEHFEVLTYKGTGAAQTIKGTDWEGDDELCMFKARSAAQHGGVFDSVRGAGELIHTSLTNAQSTNLTELSAFTNSGPTLLSLIHI